MLRAETRGLFLWQMEAPAATYQAPTAMDDEITAAQDLPGVEDVPLDSSVEIDVRTPHGGHMRRHMLANHTNAELRLLPPELDEAPSRIERPVLTEEIALEQSLLDEQALLASNEREALAARQMVLEAHAADVQAARSSLDGATRRDSAERMTQPRGRKPVLWPVALSMDEEEDTDVDEVHWVSRALRGRR